MSAVSQDTAGAKAKTVKPQLVPHVLLGNGCLADEFPHKTGCRCEECAAIWARLIDEDKKRNQ